MIVPYERGADVTAVTDDHKRAHTVVEVSLRSLWVGIITQTAVHLYDLPVVPDSFDAQS